MDEGKKLFIGRKVSEEIKALSKLKFLDIGKESVDSIVSSVLESILETANASTHGSIKNLSNQDFLVLVSGIHKLLLLILKSNLQSKEALEEELNELKLDPLLVSAVVGTVFHNREDLFKRLAQTGPKTNILNSFAWKVNVGISNSSLSKELQAVVMFKMVTSDGKIHVFEVPQKKFHELRFNVAMVLKEMELLENSRYLSISDSK